ncbi:uncharacterized protein LOC136025838 isoform X2 [Artemia franciscana]|uniref:uncharacterized protein LOC136025838 isoform X2 n=1 Tax=Artemia franciscana TaxID=6661 RepID=UPI0032DB2492
MGAVSLTHIWIILLSLSVAFSPSLAEEIESTLGETPDGQGRFFFVPKTVTDLIKTTTTTSGGLQSWCYTVVSLISVVSTVEQSGTKDIGQATFTINSVGACRKRRWAFEDPFDESLKEILLPSAVAAKEDRATAVALDKADQGIVAEIESSQELTEKLARVGFSLIRTVTQTLTVVSSIITTTRFRSLTFTCTPGNFGIAAC